MIESSHRTYPSEKNTEMVKKLINDYPDVKNKPENPADVRLEAPEGNWASLIRIYSPVRNKTTDVYEMKDNETPLCLAIINFNEYKDDHF